MNDKKFLIETIDLLEDNGIKTWVFGGWAEEILGVIEPRKHKDIDLLYPAESFYLVDQFLIDNSEVEEISEKHFPHKRAFLYRGVMGELFLVKGTNGDYFTNFSGKKFKWPSDVFDHPQKDYRVASTSALLSYRKKYDIDTA